MFFRFNLGIALFSFYVGRREYGRWSLRQVVKDTLPRHVCFRWGGPSRWSHWEYAWRVSGRERSIQTNGTRVVFV